jgi:hypothetical protein
MQETAPHAPDAPASPASGTPPLLFFDTESAKRWAKTVPLMPVPQAYDAVLGQLRAMNGADFTPRERATIAEVLRDQVGHLHTELARRFAGKPQPAGDREREAFEQVLTLWQGLWDQYSTCLKPLLEGDPDLAGVKAKLLQRGIHVGKQIILVHGLARRLPPPGIWQELHAYYRLAEMLECAVQAVSDDLTPQAVGLSCYSTYSHALLLALADPCAMTVRQIEVADRWLEHWARKVFPYAEQRETEGPLMVIDLDGEVGATLALVPPSSPTPSCRFGYPAKLATSVRGRLKRLAAGASPAELQLGQDVSVEQAIALLAYLDAHWYQLPRRNPDVQRATLDLCAGGLPAAFFRIGGRTFDRQDPLGRLSYQGTQHLATLGALTDYDRFREEAERNFRWERWTGDYEWREAQLVRQGASHHRWFLEQLAIVRDEERVRLGYASRVALAPDGQLSLSVRLWPGSPRAIVVRPYSSAFTEEPPMPVIELAETPDEKAQLILPMRTYNPGRVLRTIDSGPERRLKLTRLLQRGGDFERVAFEVATS